MRAPSGAKRYFDTQQVQYWRLWMARKKGARRVCGCAAQAGRGCPCHLPRRGRSVPSKIQTAFFPFFLCPRPCRCCNMARNRLLPAPFITFHLFHVPGRGRGGIALTGEGLKRQWSASACRWPGRSPLDSESPTRRGKRGCLSYVPRAPHNMGLRRRKGSFECAWHVVGTRRPLPRKARMAAEARGGMHVLASPESWPSVSSTRSQ